MSYLQISSLNIIRSYSALYNLDYDQVIICLSDCHPFGKGKVESYEEFFRNHYLQNFQGISGIPESDFVDCGADTLNVSDNKISANDEFYHQINSNDESEPKQLCLFF